MIASFNNANGVVSPWLQNSIHSLLRGKRRHKYFNFRDGLHPDVRTQEEWSKLIANAIVTNKRIQAEKLNLAD